MISVQLRILSHNLASLARTRFPLPLDHELHEGGAIISFPRDDLEPYTAPHMGKRPSNHLLSRTQTGPNIKQGIPGLSSALQHYAPHTEALLLGPLSASSLLYRSSLRAGLASLGPISPASMTNTQELLPKCFGEN